MSKLRRLLLRFTTAFRVGHAERELNREVASHLAFMEDEFRRRGMTAEEARVAARRAFGGVEQTKELQRDARAFPWIDQLRQDLRFAVRAMRRTPAFTVVAILTLSVGIGANTAIFSLLDVVLFKSLSLRDPGQLYFLSHGTGAVPSLSANYPLLERYRGNVDVFEGITAYNTRQFKVSTPAGAELVDGQYAAGNYHAVLGVPMALGRGLTSDSDRPTDASLVAVISGSYWTRRFGRDSNIIGRTIVVQGRTVTIVGVTAPDFHGMRPGTQIDVTLPLAQRAMDEPGFLTMRDSWISMYLVGRLKPSVTEAVALTAIAPVFQQFWAETENELSKKSAPEVHPARLVPAGRGTGTLRLTYREPLQVLMAMVAVVLLIACSNVANLLLARASARTREVAVRLSIGASRGRLVRQFLTESAVLAVAGGILGLLLAAWGTKVIGGMLNVGTNPIVLDVDPDARVLAFAMGVSMLTALVFGLAPAIRATRVDVMPSLRVTAGGAGSGRTPLTGRTLVVSQVALCVVLVASGGLLMRSLSHLKGQNAGFQKDNLLLFYVDTRGSGKNVTEFHEALLERMRDLPGVRSAAFSTMTPLATDEETRPIRISGPASTTRPRSAVANRITPGYFSTFDIPMLRGRGITIQDSATAPHVAVINETMARDYFNADALGRTFSFGVKGPEVPVTVVGIVKDNRQRNLRQAVPPMAYIPLAQAEEPPRELTAALRASQDPRALEAMARDTVGAASPDLVMSYVRTMKQQVDASLTRERMLATMAAAFVAVALFLAAIGLYGVMSYGVTRRVREIGIRMALGAPRRTVLWQVWRTTLLLSAAGIAIGLVAAFPATRMVSSFLFGVTDRDPLTFTAAGAVLLAASLLAGYLPARRATRVDPLVALRME